MNFRSLLRDALGALFSHWRWHLADLRYRRRARMSEQWVKAQLGKEE